MQEQWTKWEPVKGLSEKYDIELLCESIKEFKVILYDDRYRKNKIIVTFKHGISAYRDTYETYRSKLIHELGGAYGEDFYVKWSLFKVENSEYMKWLTEQSYEIFDSPLHMHFAFVASDSVLDIVARYEPHVELVEY